MDRRRVYEQLPQIARKPFQVRLNAPEQAAKNVVGQHGRDRHGQPGRRHDQGLAHGAGDAVDGDLPRTCHGRERVVDAPHGPQQPYERRRGAHRGQQHLAELQAPQHVVQGIAQHAGEPLRQASGRGQRGRGHVVVICY